MKQGQFPAIIELSDFNGKNGFVIEGESRDGSSGYSITAVDDVNSGRQTELICNCLRSHWRPVHRIRRGEQMNKCELGLWRARDFQEIVFF